MMTCSGCKSQQYIGTIFCPACGISFLPEDCRPDVPAAEHKAASDRLAIQPLGIVQPKQREFRATLLNNGRQVKLSLDVPILIGRADGDRGFYPDLDLTNDGGYEAGISRRHARIGHNDQDAYIEDLESGNGTFVNNQQLPPRASRRLRAGDELRLGSIIIRIEAL